MISEVGDLVRCLVSPLIGKKLIIMKRISERYIYGILLENGDRKTSPKQQYEFQEFELEVVEKGYKKRIDRNKKIDDLLCG